MHMGSYHVGAKDEIGRAIGVKSCEVGFVLSAFERDMVGYYRDAA